MAPILYKMVASPPACSVMMLADYLGIELDCREVDWDKAEHKSPLYMEKNPMGTIPVLQDGDFVVSESHAILRYLIAKHSSNKTLYPEDIHIRSTVDQVSFFNAGVFFPRQDVAIYSLFLDKIPPTAEAISNIDKAFGVVEAYLSKRKYIAANHLTLADFSVGTTAVFMKPFYTLDAKRFPRTAEWLASLEKIPSFSKFSEPGVAELATFVAIS